MPYSECIKQSQSSMVIIAPRTILHVQYVHYTMRICAEYTVCTYTILHAQYSTILYVYVQYMQYVHAPCCTYSIVLYYKYVCSIYSMHIYYTTCTVCALYYMYMCSMCSVYYIICIRTVYTVCVLYCMYSMPAVLYAPAAQ